MHTWKIKFDDKELDCVLSGRPKLHIHEIEQPDDSFVLGEESEWEPLMVSSEEPFRWVGEKDVDIIMLDEVGKTVEVWTLKETKILPSFNVKSVYLSFNGCQYCNLEVTTCH